MRPSDWLPTPRRAAFIITNIAARPLLGSPTSVPVAPSITICAVALPWMPILCSRPAQKIGLRSPSEPSALTWNFGTTNRLMPLLPLGASGRRASTR
ncbi:hypothetical protein D9M68_641620 [compost metagenome]